MFGRKYKELKSENEALKVMLLEQNGKINTLEAEMKEMLTDEYFEWKSQYEANKKTAGKQGYFFLNSKADTILLEKVISEINNNEDLTALFRTADGTTLSLRVHPQPRMNTGIKPFTGEGEED